MNDRFLQDCLPYLQARREIAALEHLTGLSYAELTRMRRSLERMQDHEATSVAMSQAVSS